VRWFANYDAMLWPMAGMLAISSLLWLKIDPTKELAPEERAPEPVGVGRV